MPTHYHAGTRSTLGKNRVEALSDGVFAVAITLLILNLQSPDTFKIIIHWDLHQFVWNILPRFIAYILSFIIVGIYWVAHHNTFHYIKHSDRYLLWLNILLLICIVFIPFTTALLGLYPGERISILVYGGTLIATGITLQLVWWYATHDHHLVDKDIDPRLVAKATHRNILGPCVYTLALIISFFSIPASLTIFILVPLLYILPGSVDRHWTVQGEDNMNTLEERQTRTGNTHHDISRPGKYIPGEEFYQSQIAALEAHDTERLLMQYHPDAKIVGFDFMVQGHEAIRTHFKNYLQHLGEFKLKNTDKFIETDDAIFFEATMTVASGEVKVYNIFLIHKDRATHHFTGVIAQETYT